MFEFGIVGLIFGGLEIGGWAYLFNKAKREAINRTLTHKKQIKEFKYLDERLRKQIGAHPTPFQRKVTKRVVMASRFIVNTKAWEYVVAGFIDPNSEIRKGNKKFKVWTDKINFNKTH